MSDDTVIAICEDDADIRELLAAYLAANGFMVETADGGEALEAMLARRPIALVVLDWMLPGEDGVAIARRLRSRGGPPVVMLTARDEDVDRVAALDGGADDYVSKPFNPRVLLARINAVLRRGQPAVGERLIVSDLVIEPDIRRVLSAAGTELMLTAAEFDLLLSFAQSPQRVLSRDRLLDLTRGRVAEVFDRTIDMQISRLRRRLEEAGSEVAAQIRTIRNAGYMLAAPVRRG